MRAQVGERRAGGGGTNLPRGVVAVRVGEKYRAGLRVERLDLAYAIVFLCLLYTSRCV